MYKTDEPTYIFLSLILFKTDYVVLWIIFVCVLHGWMYVQGRLWRIDHLDVVSVLNIFYMKEWVRASPTIFGRYMSATWWRSGNSRHFGYAPPRISRSRAALLNARLCCPLTVCHMLNRSPMLTAFGVFCSSIVLLNLYLHTCLYNPRRPA